MTDSDNIERELANQPLESDADYWMRRAFAVEAENARLRLLLTLARSCFVTESGLTEEIDATLKR